MLKKPDMKRQLFKGCLLFFGAVLLLFVSWPGLGITDEITNLAKKLTEMRGEVEALENQLKLKEQKLKNELDSLAQQKADLEMQIEKEQLRIKELNAAMKRRKEDIQKYSVSGDQLKPILLEAIGEAKSYIKTALPFKVPERISELEKIESQIKSGVMRPEKSAMMLWAFIEDEFRLSRESNLDRQIIAIDGQEKLSDVVRIGMLMIFFQTKDGQVGRAIKENGSWTYREYSGTDQKEQIVHLFDSFKKQIRVGYFELPNALPESGVAN